MSSNTVERPLFARPKNRGGETPEMCSRCILDDYDSPALGLDDKGVCEYCRVFDERWRKLQETKYSRKRDFDELVARIKREEAGKPYDCLVGVSGGVDSSYLIMKVCDLGLRPLVVHFDNGWNSELAVDNIHNIVNGLGLDLFTYVVDWEEFRDLQRAYFKAAVVDIEVATDHAIYGTLYRQALANGIRYIFGGNNQATEGIVPLNWIFHKCDHINLRDIHRRYGTRPLKSYPIFDRATKLAAVRAGIQIVEPLDLFDFRKDRAMAEIKERFNWRPYPAKHGESVFTRFYQNYVLPEKFHIDKRKSHLSALICSGEITRDEALRQMGETVYPAETMRIDKDFVVKKLGFTEAEFEEIMAAPIRQHFDFEIEGSLFYEYRWLLPIQPLWRRLQSMLGLTGRGRSTGLERR